MSVLLAAAERFRAEVVELTMVVPTVVGYAAVIRAGRAADDTYMATAGQPIVAQAKQRVREIERVLPALEQMLESEQTEDKSWLYRRYDQLTEDKKHLLERADQLQSAHRASAIRSRQWSDLMLLLMVLGVVGSISLAVAHMFIAAPLILGISPAAYLAYWRLARASKDAGDMAHAERMRQVEYDGKQLELEAKRQEIAEKREAGQLELQRKRVELESKQLELAEKLRQ